MLYPAYNIFMSYEFERTGVVDENHQVILSLPDIPVGTTVVVSVESVRKQRRLRKPLGWMSDQLLGVSDEFDKPLPEFADYS